MNVDISQIMARLISHHVWEFFKWPWSFGSTDGPWTHEEAETIIGWALRGRFRGRAADLANWLDSKPISEESGMLKILRDQCRMD